MVYSEVPDIAAALSAGYSALWNANEQEIDTTDHWSAVLQEQEDNLLKTVKDYNCLSKYISKQKRLSKTPHLL